MLNGRKSVSALTSEWMEQKDLGPILDLHLIGKGFVQRSGKRKTAYVSNGQEINFVGTGTFEFGFYDSL